jgi:tetratricopeptide (TPR) repeat protein
MITLSTRVLYFAPIFAVALAMCTPRARSQATNTNGTAAIEGKVQDSQNHPLAAAVISLDSSDSIPALTSTADPQGQFRFESVPPGRYTLHVKLSGYAESIQGPFVLHDHETKSVMLSLTQNKNQATAKDSSSAMAFSDEPTFTVAGVTDTTALGGHGSGPIVRNSDALSKETASLARENSAKPNAATNDSANAGPAQQAAAIRAKLAHEDNADLHAQLADIEESQGHPLEAQNEYQRAAQMDPSEPHLFAWGAELLLHHAPEPAIEVFSKGRRLYPQSSRMMLGLGAAWYAERSKDQAEQIFMQACDVNPADPTPYLFLGKLQVTQQVVTTAWTDRMKRFVALHPEMAAAHYLYGVALMKQEDGKRNRNLAEAELKTAIKLNPQFGDAYLYLGILCSDIGDFPAAIAALQKAVELKPLPDDAHYRLAQLYRRMGDVEKANQEIAQFKQIAEQKDTQAERERHEIPQFVYTLREQNPPSPPSSPDSH